MAAVLMMFVTAVVAAVGGGDGRGREVVVEVQDGEDGTAPGLLALTSAKDFFQVYL